MYESQVVNEWRREGAVEALRETLLELLEDRFGRVDDQVRERILATSDPVQLRQAVRQVSGLSRPEDLRL
jgi:hypothetical protein